MTSTNKNNSENLNILGRKIYEEIFPEFQVTLKEFYECSKEVGPRKGDRLSPNTFGKTRLLMNPNNYARSTIQKIAATFNYINQRDFGGGRRTALHFTI